MYSNFMFLDRSLFELSFKNTHTHTHTHADSNPLLWLTYLISLTMFSCNDDHLRAAPSGYPHQVIHISNTQGTQEQVSSPSGRGADPKPLPQHPPPLCAPRLGPRSRAGQMPESGMNLRGLQ